MAQSLRFRIQNFIDYFKNFIYYMVIESEWNNLMSESKKCTHFNKLV